MNKKIEQLINAAVINIIKKCSTESKIKKLEDTHSKKIHFIPQRYRVFGGLLQSMNIQFGNFIEELMTVILENESKYEVLKKYSGKKSNSFELSVKNEQRIDEYISKCQNPGANFNIDVEFQNLLKTIVNDKDTNFNRFKHDIDLLFRDKSNDVIYYLEIKYNDDHDTGKFVDINRKFIKTYAYLVREFKIKDYTKVKPILFFFNNKIMKGNIYVPEKTNIRRGEGFFKEFLSISYDDVDNCLTNLSESPEVLKMFDKLYQNIVKQ